MIDRAFTLGCRSHLDAYLDRVIGLALTFCWPSALYGITFQMGGVI